MRTDEELMLAYARGDRAGFKELFERYADLAQLPEENRSVIELHWFDGLSFAEVAKCLGIGAVAAKVRAHRGYQRLRKLLEGDLEASAGGNPTGRSGI